MGLVDLYTILTRMRSSNDATFRSELTESGDPGRWLASEAPNLSGWFPQVITVEMLLRDTRAAWTSASDRIGQCTRCPPYGGACAGDISVMREGMTASLGDDGQLKQTPCPRWKQWVERQRLLDSGLPEALLPHAIEHVLSEFTYKRTGKWKNRDALLSWIYATRDPKFGRWLLLTGDNHMLRTRVLAAVTRELVRGHRNQNIHYAWAPGLAVRMREFLDKASPDNPFAKCEAAEYLAMDFVDPNPKGRAPWADWFSDRVQNMFFSRLSKPTVIASPRSVETLRESLPMISGFLDPIVIDVGKHLGPIG